MEKDREHALDKRVNLPGYGRILIIALSMAGILISGYLWLIHFMPANRTSVLFRICSAGAFDCGRVSSSEYAVLLGIPLAAWGVAFYLLVILYLFLHEIVDRETRNALNVSLLWMTGVAAFSTIPLLIISLFAIRAFCLYCVLSWICNIALFVTMIKITGGGGQGYLVSLTAAHTGALRFLIDCHRYFFQIMTMAVTAVLVLLSIIFLSATMRLQGDLFTLRENTRIEERVMENYLGRAPVRINLTGVPVFYGHPDAKVTVVEFFNFDCGVCRAASREIKTVMDKFPGKVKLHLLHYPLDGHCNRNVREKGDALTCKASLIAMALQRTKLYPAYVNHIMMKKEALDRDMVLKALEVVEMDAEKLQKLMDEREAEKALVLQILEAEQLRVDGTPTFVINGKPLPAGLPPTRFLEKVMRLEVKRAYGE